MREFARFILTCSVLLAAAPAPAAPAGEAADPPAGWRWNVDYGDRQCSLIRMSDPARAPIFAVQTIPGSWNWNLRLIARRWPSGALRNLEELTISLQPDGTNLPGLRRIERTASGEAIVTYLLSNPLEKLAAARSVRVQRGGENIMEIPLINTAEAVAALSRCLTETLREWGIDPAIYARVRDPLGGGQRISDVVSDADYPYGAIQNNLSGQVTVRLTIGVDGRVSDCVPVVSSGHAILDERTCLVYRNRLRMTPAIGMDGMPMAVPLVTSVRWILPD
jgi:TonB family protein